MRILPSLFLALALLAPSPALPRSSPADAVRILKLESQLRRLKPENPQRLLIPYLRWLRTGKAREARAYIRGVEQAALARGAQVDGLHLFEGCILPLYEPGGGGRADGGKCVSDLFSGYTERYFVPRVRKLEPLALEVLYVHSAAASADGAESEGLATLIGEVGPRAGARIGPIAKRHEKLVQRLGGHPRWEGE
jgi:hypothetical protein